MLNAKKISIKEFTEAMTEILNHSSPDELRAILVAMANEVDLELRDYFIKNLKQAKSNFLSQGAYNPVNQASDILETIDFLRVEMEACSTEEPDWSYYDPDDECETLGIFGCYVVSLDRLFDQVEAIFDNGQYEIAKKAYHNLFELLEIQNEYGMGVRLSDLRLDPDETRAKYVRSIYLSEEGENRVEYLSKAMECLSNLDFKERSKINDLVEIVPDPLPEFPEFLKTWIEKTQTLEAPQYEAWLRQATFLLEGSEGLERLAHQKGPDNPRIYIDWICALMSQKDYPKALEAGSSALNQVARNKPIRAAIADLMIQCGEILCDQKIIRENAWHSFEAKPNLSKLMNLYHLCKPSERFERMTRAASIIETQKGRPSSPVNSWEKDDIEEPSRLTRCLLMHAYLLGQNESKAFELAQMGEFSDWNYPENAQPLFVAYCLARATQQSLGKLPAALNRFFCTTLESSTFFYSCDKTTQELLSIYQKIFAKPCLLNASFLEWCVKAIEARVNAVISNRDHNAYKRAALLTVACVDALKFVNPTEASGLFARIKYKYPRCFSFQLGLRQIGKHWGLESLQGHVETI